MCLYLVYVNVLTLEIAMEIFCPSPERG